MKRVILISSFLYLSFIFDIQNSIYTLAYYTGTEESYASLQDYSENLDMISIDVFNVQDDGTIIQYDDLGAADYAVQHGLQIYACVSNYRGEPLWDFDPALARAAIRPTGDTFIDEQVTNAGRPALRGGQKSTWKVNAFWTI